MSAYQRIVRVIVRRTRTRIRRTVYAKCVVLVPVTYGSVLPTMLHDVRGFTGGVMFAVFK